MKMKTKHFDCVEMKRRGAERVQRETEGLGTAEKLAYWKAGTLELLAEQKILREGLGNDSPRPGSDANSP